jgi:putative membrane protein
MSRLMGAIAIVACVCWTNASRADEQPLDDNFLIKAAEGDHVEIEAGKLADKHAASPHVKEFAQRLVQDHQKNYDKLAALIKGRKIAIVSGTEKGNREEIDRLSKLQGAEFDREFIRWTVASHQKTIALFENQAKNGKNGDVRSFASESLPAIREHLKRAEELAKSIQ